MQFLRISNARVVRATLAPLRDRFETFAAMSLREQATPEMQARMLPGVTAALRTLD